MNLRIVRGCCFLVGSALLLWTTVDFFILAFLTSRFLEGAGLLLWMQGYWEALRSSPVARAGALLLLFALCLKKS